MDKIELKPCPFCGGKMRLLGKDPVKIGIVMDCTECHIRVAVPWAYDAEHGIPAFNKRAPGWIPCSERMPESAGVAVIVSAKNRYDQNAVFIAFQGYGDFKWHTMTAGYMNHEHGTEISDAWTITHWMPLPEPPEDKENENRMTMKDIEKSCRCKYAKLSCNNAKRTTVTTVCIECRLKNDVTDPKHCAKCKDRKEGKK